MASRLLNVLNEIEEGRQICIKELKNLDYPIDDNATFKDIAEDLELIPHYDNTDVSLDYSSDYENPLDDPEIWHKDPTWADIVSLANAMEDIEDDGINYYPIGVVEIETKSDAVIRFNNNTSGVPTGVDINLWTSKYDNAYRFKYVLSDGFEFKQYYQTAVTDHTFTDSATIKYVYIYGANLDFDSYNNSKGVVVDTDSVIRQVAWFAKTLKSFTLPATCQYLLAPITNLHAQIQRRIANTYSFQAGRWLEFMPNLGVDFDGQRTSLTTDNGFKVIIMHTGNNYGASVTYTDSYGLNMDYFEYPFGAITIQSRASAGYGSPKYAMNRIKYWVVTNLPEHGAPDTLLTYQGYKHFAFLTDITKSVWPEFSSISLNNLFEKSFDNVRGVIFPNLETLSGANVFERCGFETLELPKLTRLDVSLGYIPSLKNIYLPKVTTITAAQTGLEFLVKLDLPELITLSVPLFGTDVNSVFHLKQLSIPKIQELPENAFYALKHLNTLNLPNNFKCSLDLSNCSKLTKTCVLDIFNRLADVSEEETVYTLKLNKYIQAYISTSELAIATNKGWQVTFNNGA